MGINATFQVVRHSRHAPSAAYVLRELVASLGDAGTLVDQERLTLERWSRDKHLFGIAATPLDAFDLAAWPQGSEWTLVTTSYPKGIGDWQGTIARVLGTRIEQHNVCEIANASSVCAWGPDGKPTTGEQAAGLEWHIPDSYAALATYPGRRHWPDAFVTLKAPQPVPFDRHAP